MKTTRYIRVKKKMPRRNRLAVLLNDSEQRALDNYCRKYNIQNRSKFIRETLMKNILHRFDTDSPTLFD
ncbi:MAG: hypothetical protein IJ650_02130 [Paludibacteraceae bacterium]|nr:hypothetical protein [Paludibacteraceae bacterium]